MWELGIWGKVWVSNPINKSQVKGLKFEKLNFAVRFPYRRRFRLALLRRVVPLSTGRCSDSSGALQGKERVREKERKREEREREREREREERERLLTNRRMHPTDFWVLETRLNEVRVWVDFFSVILVREH